MRLFVLLVGILCSTATSAQTSYSLTYTGAELIQNQHVGNEWTRVVRLNGEWMDRGRTFLVEPTKDHAVVITVEETNEKFIDEGQTSLTLTPDLLGEYASTGEFHVDVSVKEGHGRYAGGVATWRFFFTLE